MSTERSVGGHARIILATHTEPRFHVSSWDDPRMAAYTSFCGCGNNPRPQKEAGLKGVSLFREQLGIIPHCSQNALCIMWRHRAHPWGDNGAKPHLAMPYILWQ